MFLTQSNVRLFSIIILISIRCTIMFGVEDGLNQSGLCREGFRFIVQINSSFPDFFKCFVGILFGSLRPAVLYMISNGSHWSIFASATLSAASITSLVLLIKLIPIRTLTATFLPMSTLNVVLWLFVVRYGMWKVTTAES